MVAKIRATTPAASATRRSKSTLGIAIATTRRKSATCRNSTSGARISYNHINIAAVPEPLKGGRSIDQSEGGRGGELGGSGPGEHAARRRQLRRCVDIEGHGGPQLDLDDYIRVRRNHVAPAGIAFDPFHLVEEPRRPQYGVAALPLKGRHDNQGALPRAKGLDQAVDGFRRNARHIAQDNDGPVDVSRQGGEPGP